MRIVTRKKVKIMLGFPVELLRKRPRKIRRHDFNYKEKTRQA